MGKHADCRMAQGSKHPRSLLVPREIEVRMNAGNHEVEGAQSCVVDVEGAVTVSFIRKNADRY